MFRIQGDDIMYDMKLLEYTIGEFLVANHCNRSLQINWN